MLDEHGQTKNRAINYHRNFRKTVESLLGICHGLLANNELDDSEILFLDNWMKENRDVTLSWPGDVIAERVQRVLADGVITAEETADLKETLEKIVGAGLYEDGITSGMATSFPVEQVDAIDFNGRSFCFTGRFLFGSRNACHNAVEERGGIAAKGVTRNLSYLVIGTLASRDWAHTSHGRKIEKVMQYNEGVDIRTFVLAEEDWVKCL